MTTKTKVLALALCAVLLVVTTVFVTMAFLTSKDSVKNTFTVGKVTITLDEAKVTTDGAKVEGAERVKENSYHLIPGHFYVKDPTIHVDDESEDCWLFVKVENGLKDIIDTRTIEEQLVDNGWSLVDGESNIYAYKEIATAETKDYKVFDNFKLKGDADVALYATADNEDSVINVTAYAIQADGFDTAAAAWADAGAKAQAN